MRRSLSLLGMCLVGTCISRAPAQDVIPAHGLSRNQASCDEPQRIVIKLPPPRVEYQDKCSDKGSQGSDSSRRCSLFGHRHRAEETRSSAVLPNVMFAPVNLPAMVVQPSVPAAASFTHQITHDFSALQNAHELEMRAAALAAHSAAKRAMADAENELLQGSLDRVHKKMSAMASAAAASAGAEGKVSLDTALRNLDSRLTQLEVLVMQHQQMLTQKDGKKVQPESK